MGMENIFDKVEKKRHLEGIRTIWTWWALPAGAISNNENCYKVTRVAATSASCQLDDTKVVKPESLGLRWVGGAGCVCVLEYEGMERVFSHQRSWDFPSPNTLLKLLYLKDPLRSLSSGMVVDIFNPST